MEKTKEVKLGPPYKDVTYDRMISFRMMEDLVNDVDVSSANRNINRSQWLNLATKFYLKHLRKKRKKL